MRNPPVNARDVGLEDALEKEMATHSSILAWEVPWTEEPAGSSPWGQEELDVTEHHTQMDLLRARLPGSDRASREPVGQPAFCSGSAQWVNCRVPLRTRRRLGTSRTQLFSCLGVLLLVGQPENPLASGHSN